MLALLSQAGLHAEGPTPNSRPASSLVPPPDRELMSLLALINASVPDDIRGHAACPKKSKAWRHCM